MNFFDRISQRQTPSFGMPIARPQYPAMPAPDMGAGTVYHDPNANIEGPWTTDDFAYGRETLGNFGQAEPAQAAPMDNPFGVDPGDAFWEPAPVQGPQEGDYYAPEIAPQPQYPAPQNAQPQPYTPPVSGRGIVEEDVEAPALGGVRGGNDPRMQAATPEALARAAQVQQQLGTMINDRSISDDQIRTWVGEQGLVPDGLEEALTYRRVNPHYQVPVFATPTGQAKPVAAPPPEVSKERSFVLGGIDTLSLGSDNELYGAGKAVDYLFGQAEGDSFYDAYVRGSNARQAEKDAALYHRPGYYIGGQIVGGIATAPIGGAAVNTARGVGLLRGGSLVRGLQTGGVTGGIYGFNSDTGGVVDRLDGAAFGGAFGTVAAGALGTVGAGARRLYRNGRSSEVIDAADRVNDSLGTNIRPSVAHMGRSGNGAGESIRGRAALGMRQTIPGLMSLDGRLTQFGDDVTDGIQALAGRTGAVSDDLADAAARQLQQRPGTIGGYRETSRVISDGLYTQADNLGGGTLITPTRTVASLDNMIANLARSPGTEGARNALLALRGEVASQQWTAAGLRDMRTRYGRQLNAVDGVTRGEANQMWAALSRDITDGLHTAGRSDAARAYRTADRYYARRANTVRIVDRLIGKRETGFHSAEQVAANLSRMARTDADELQTVLRQLPRQEAGDVRGSIVRQLGIAPANKQGDVPTFSINTFGTEWAKLTPRVKSVLFDQQTVRDLDDLATLATAAKSIPANASNSFTGAGMAANALQAGAIGGLIWQGSSENGVGVTGALGGAFALGAGVILGDRRVLRQIVNWGRTGNAAGAERAITAALKRTGNNPAWQMELIGLRDYITGHDSRPQINLSTASENGASVFDEQAAPTGKASIFADDDEDASIFAQDGSDPQTMINPFETDDDENTGSELEGLTPQDLIEQGRGDEPLY